MYDQNKLIEILTTSEYRCLDANGKCFPPSNSMYEKISKKMMEVDTHISPKHIYTILNIDRRGIRSLLLEAFGLKNNVAHDESSKSNFSENSFECQNKLDDCKMYDDKIFKLIISVTDSSGNNSIHNIQDDSHNIQAHSRVSDSLSSPSNECPLNFQENWMGLINKNTNKTGGIKKKSYLDKCPEWDCVESTDTIFIPIIKNGNCCQPVTLHGKTIMVRNTCAFDALLHITAHIIGMDAEYKLNIQDIDDCFLQLAKKIVLQGKITKNEYSARALFLINTSLFKTYKYTRRFETLDAMCNAAHLAEYTFASLPSLHRSKKCQMCNYSNERNFTAISINVNILLQKGLQYIQEAINDAIATTQHCVKCNNSYTVSEKYSPQILIDTSVLTDDNYLKDMGLQVTTYTVESIAKNITIGNKKYTLRGVVNYLKQASHYTALLYTNVSWYEYDDLKSKRQQVSPQKYIILPHVLLYAQTK